MVMYRDLIKEDEEKQKKKDGEKPSELIPLLACPDDLVNEHWDYIEKVLENYAGKPMYLHMIEFHYKKAFKHGWKHAMQEKAG